MTKLIVVFGATGAQGGSVIKFVSRHKDFKIRAVTRDPTKDSAKKLEKEYGVELVKGDLNDTEFPKSVFEDAYGVFLVTNFWDPASQGKEFGQGKRIADLAKEAGVKHFQWSSLSDVEKESNGKYDVPHFTQKAKLETYIRSKGFEFTSFPAAAFYYQNFLTFFPPKKDEKTGKLTFTLPESSSVTAFDVNDTGAVVTAAFQHPHKWNGRFIPISGEHFTWSEFIEKFNKATGKGAVLNLVPRETFAKFGFPGAEELAEMFGWFDEFGYYGRAGKRELGLRAYHDLKSLSEWFEENKSAFDKF
mmetsp:Transcript_13454/g.23244  ORF Transcript_13454/g.23244 Transcript_13454/m.23244 type:complete len:303 (+) Transcript_13454:140-1048(+)